jgi:hypothetical protein
MKLVGRKRLGEIAIDADIEKALAILSHGVRGEGDDRSVTPWFICKHTTITAAKPYPKTLCQPQGMLDSQGSIPFALEWICLDKAVDG